VLQEGVAVAEALSISKLTAADEERALLSIVIPLYNEEGTIEGNLTRLAEFFDSLVGAGKWLFILVDNGSTDTTPAKVRNALEHWPPSREIRLSRPNYGAALRAGLTTARTRWVYLLDIEQWDLPFIAWSWVNRNSYDIFLASKRADPTINFQQPYRRFLSCCLNSVLQGFLEFSGTDTHGPKLINRPSLEGIIQVCELDRGQYDTELVLRAMRKQKRVIEVPVVYKESRPNRNWMIKKIAWNVMALRKLIRIMKHVPYEGHIRYHRLGREDILAELENTPLKAVESGRA
jgi:glycosyltransferase involved in cell wall biosynthesis